MTASAADVLVLGRGAVGLASAFALSRLGARVCLIGEPRPGEASIAAAGMLAPSVEFAHGMVPAAVHAFAFAARDRYPEYLSDLGERSGRDVPLNRLGILRVALDETAADVMHPTGNGKQTASWLDGSALREMEPSLLHGFGAVLFPQDGAVDTLALLAALQAALTHATNVVQVADSVHEISFTCGEVTCRTARGERFVACEMVLAGGAWSPQLKGLPRRLPVEPVRGQTLEFQGSPLRHVVYGHSASGRAGYLVPRAVADRTIAGSTMERVGFDASTTESARSALRAMAVSLCPALSSAALAQSGAGLRPVTPDFLPIVGRDPERPSLIYACGHSRNGILLAPLTADCVAAIATESDISFDITPFRVTRFDAAAPSPNPLP